MPTDPNRPPAEDDEFFVGYFPTPPGQRRFLVGVVLAMVLLTAGVAAGAALLQRDPGPRDQSPTELTGVLLLEPVPLLRHLDGATGEPVTTILAGGRKSGAEGALGDRASGSVVRLNGRLDRRGGATLLEAWGAQDAELAPAERARLAAPAPESLGEVSIVGEVIDSKCWFGAMRPGNGPTHRACAQLCILGGVPPILVAHDEAGRPAAYVLADEDGRGLGPRVLPWVAQAVEARGELERRGDLRVLRLRPEDLRRR